MSNLESEKNIKTIGLPPLVFMFTVDQIASMLAVSEKRVMEAFLYYGERTTGRMPRHQMRTINIAPSNEKAEWRIPSREFLAWCKRMGVKISDFNQIR